MKFRASLLSFLSAAVCFLLFAFCNADDPLELLLRRINAYAELNPQEKVHLHLDKPYYAIGDRIWFKAYVSTDLEDRSTQLSQLLYVELINPGDSVSKQLILPLTSGITWGSVQLADTLQEGNYRIRAYTNHMRNAGEEFFYDRTIKIGNAWANQVFTHTSFSYTADQRGTRTEAKISYTDKKGIPYAARPVSYEVFLQNKTVERGKAFTNSDGEIILSFSGKSVYPQSGYIQTRLDLVNKQRIDKRIPIHRLSAQTAVQFFPESGYLVEGLPAKVGVKSLGTTGLAEPCTGTVVDQVGQLVVKFKTAETGMGSFFLSPQPGMIYQAKIEFRDGSTQTLQLPPVKQDGYVLAVNHRPDQKLQVKAMLSKSMLDKGELRIMVQHNQKVLSTIKILSDKQLTNVLIPEKDLPSGLIRLTLFDNQNRPLAERLAFVHNAAEEIDIDLQGIETSYKKRGNVLATLQATAAGQPVNGSFSVSVTNTNIVIPETENESNILTTLLLTSDLRGYVEKPNQYLADRQPATLEKLDDLLLTQGWSRYSWKDILADQQAKPVFGVEKSLAISGTVLTTGGKPVAGGKISLFSNKDGVLLLDTLTDASGRFNFDNLAFNDTTKFVVQARTAKDKKHVEIKMDLRPAMVATRNKNFADITLNVNEAISRYILRSEAFLNDQTSKGLLQRSFQLNEVQVRTERKKTIRTDNLNGSGNADRTLLAAELGTCVRLSDCLQGKVAGLVIQTGKAYLVRSLENPMQIVVDGMNVDPEFLDDINPVDVETVEILKSINYTAIYGMRAAGGVLLITTKRGDSRSAFKSYIPGLVTVFAQGYTSSPEFYSPVYTPEQKPEGRDLRSTVWWKPNLYTGTGGNTKINFYNTDESGTYRVVIEGMDNLGRPGRKVLTYTVD